MRPDVLAWLALGLEIAVAMLTVRVPVVAIVLVPLFVGLAMFAAANLVEWKGYPRWLGIGCALLGGAGLGVLMAIALPTLPRPMPPPEDAHARGEEPDDESPRT